MKRGVIDRLFLFSKQGISEWRQNMNQKIINRGVSIRFVGNPHVYKASESNYFIAACANGTHRALLNV